MGYISEVSTATSKNGLTANFTYVAQFTKAGGGLKALFSLPAMFIAKIFNLSVTATVTDAAIRSKFSVGTQVVAAPFSF